jgi:tetratricopeptide (TPR) repeat protein
MRRKPPLALAIAATILLTASLSLAQSKSLPPITPTPPQSPDLKESEVKKLIQDEIKDGGAIRDRVQTEVTRSFGHSMTLIQILLGFLVLFPFVSAGLLWCFRESIKAQLVDEAKKQVKNEVEAQIKSEVREELQEKIDHLENEFNQLIQRYEIQAKKKIQELPSLIQPQSPKSASPYMPPPCDFPQPPPPIVLPTQSYEKNISIAGKLSETKLAQAEILLSLTPQIQLSAEEYFKFGNGLFDADRLEEAIESYDKAIELNPDYSEAWSNKGVTLSALGRYGESIQSYNKAIELKSDYYDAFYNKGVALDNLCRYKEAIQSYDKATELKSDYYDAFYNKGVALGILSQFEEAINSYDRVIELKPDYSDAFYNKGIALGNLGRHEEAINSYNKVIELKPNFPSAWFNRACTYALINEADKAIADLRKAIALDPTLRNEAETDPEFDAIRNDDRFQQLLASDN